MQVSSKQIRQMAQKIKGRASHNQAYPGRHYSFSDMPSGRGVEATLVIGDERVFTESEVMAMLQSPRFNALVQSFFSKTDN
jgi:hypothetical protein